MKLSEALREVIRLGDGSRVYWDRELPKRHPHYPLIHADEDRGPPPPEEAQIKSLLQSLPEHQIYALTLLMYVGRGDFTVEHLLSDYEKIKEAFPSKELAIAQMTGKGTLAEYLTDAVEEIEKHHIDVDNVNFESTVAAD